MSKLEIYRPREERWWDRALRSLRLGPYSSKDPALAALFGGRSSAAGIVVTEDTAFTLSTFWAAVQLIAGDVGSLPLHVFKRNKEGGGRERMTWSPLYRLLHDSPNPEMTSMTFRETLTAHVLVSGNGFAEIERDGAGRPIALWPLTPDRVSVDRHTGRDGAPGGIRYRIRNARGSETYIEPANMFHLHGLGWDGMTGMSVVAHARESLGLALAAERFGAAFFGNGASFGGVFEHPTRMTDKARENFVRSIQSRHSGVDRAHHFLVVEDGMKYQRLGIPPEDAQFLESRQFQVAEIARWFSCPPTKLGDLSRATYSNSESENRQYYAGCLRRWLTRWEQEILLKLVPASERGIMFAEFLPDAILRADTSSRYSAYFQGRQGGWLSVNDIRAMENLPPIENGDVYLQPLNMTPAPGGNDDAPGNRSTTRLEICHLSPEQVEQDRVQVRFERQRAAIRMAERERRQAQVQASIADDEQREAMKHRDWKSKYDMKLKLSTKYPSLTKALSEPGGYFHGV